MAPFLAKCAAPAVQSLHAFQIPSGWEPNGKILPFFGHKSATYGAFSNFYPHTFDFILPDYCRKPDLPGTVTVKFSEAAIMLVKASLMGDVTTFQQIQEAPTAQKAKQLGRQVAHFDEVKWLAHLEETAFAVVYQKFASSSELRVLLLRTGSQHIAEMTANDRLWGTGVNKGTPEAERPSAWPGKNRLGIALMQVRRKLILAEQPVSAA